MKGSEIPTSPEFHLDELRELRRRKQEATGLFCFFSECTKAIFCKHSPAGLKLNWGFFSAGKGP